MTTMKTPASKVRTWLSDPNRDRSDGQTLVEYSLIIVLVVIACIVAVTSVANVMEEKYWALISAMPFIGPFSF